MYLTIALLLLGYFQLDPVAAAKCRATNKIFLVGFPRAGSFAIDQALQSVGIKTCHQVVKGQLVGKLMYESAAKGEKLLARLPDDCQAITHMDYATGEEETFFPQLLYTPVLDLQYPCSKFILNKRDVKKHIASISRMPDLRARIQNGQTPYLLGKKDEDLADWIELHYESMALFFEVRPQDYLELDVDAPAQENQAKLEKFLGVKGMKWAAHSPDDEM